VVEIGSFYRLFDCGEKLKALFDSVIVVKIGSFYRLFDCGEKLKVLFVDSVIVVKIPSKTISTIMILNLSTYDS
jgi:hypothetical protein